MQIYLENSNKQILQEMQSSGFNIVTCGDCGSIRLHHTGAEKLDCEYCGLESDVSDFPDLYVVEEKKLRKD